jgi:hypothetical protein
MIPGLVSHSAVHCRIYDTHVWRLMTDASSTCSFSDAIECLEYLDSSCQHA